MSRDQDDGLGCQEWCLSCQMDLHDRCGDPTGCHLDPPDGEEPDRAAAYEQTRRELLEQRAGIEREQAKLRELHDALEGATGGGEAIEQP